MHLQAFTQWMLVATGGLGWWPGRWPGHRGGVHHPAKTVGEHQPMRIIGVASDPEPALVMQPVVSRTEASQVPSVGRAVAVVGVPVDDVMDVQELIRGAPRNPTPAIPQDHQPAGALGDGALGCVRH